ncbi:MAG: hypothetical protein COX81_03495 [Candidatus Magasanikbacteria bacterium CG_4_10_14_0_2_um_filter_37_12]|uniref:Uncharacterized protein n=1 Tax=Candidatus Magasanikbacteria bacterium CG_4_10_14_0_2_um_filter_37_12 TaxID=1974637 RepID=A0A2M7V712_9BACT|nr:MAG: hypothetical protein COX81_03495 [Candidatus Magasanikbacteria bacterium CG_4_10_14_0_2_um_filter_37_12]
MSERTLGMEEQGTDIQTVINNLSSNEQGLLENLSEGQQAKALRLAGLLTEATAHNTFAALKVQQPAKITLTEAVNAVKKTIR